MEKIKVGILLSGTGSNFQALLNACQEPNFPAEIVSVGSNKLNTGGIAKARAAGLDTFVANYRESHKVERFADMFFKEKGVDLICLAGYMKILTKEFIKEWNGKILNIHPSLLPSFKGLHAQRQAFEYGVKYSGCTVHWVVPEMDAGPIIGQRIVSVVDDDTEESLSKRILVQEHILYPEALNIIASTMLGGKCRQGR